MKIQPNKKYFDATSPYRVNIKDYWSDKNVLHRMYDWQTRASYEFTRHADEMDYRVYFITLTFNETFLPRFRTQTEQSFGQSVTKCMDKNGHANETCTAKNTGFTETCYTVDKLFDLPYFNTEIINKFWNDFRKDLWRSYGIKDIPYFCAGDYGKKKRRPHYHCLLALPAILKPSEVHAKIKQHWSVQVYDQNGKRVFRDGKPLRESYGFILPADPAGGMDQHGYNHKPMEIDPTNIPNATKYAAKYALKSVSTGKPTAQEQLMEKLLIQNGQYDEYKEWKKGQAKIKTSLNFGAAIDQIILNSKSPCDDLYNGFKDLRVNEDSLVQVPEYNKRRLLFKNVFMYSDTIDVYDWRTDTIKEKKRYFYKKQRSPLGVAYHKYELPLNILAFRDHAIDTLNKIQKDSDYIKTRAIQKSDIELMQQFASFNMAHHLSCYKFCYAGCVDPSLTPSNSYPAFIPQRGMSLKSLSANAIRFKTQNDGKDVHTLAFNTVNPADQLFNAWPQFTHFDAIISVIEQYDELKDIHYRDIVNEINLQSEINQAITEIDLGQD